MTAKKINTVAELKELAAELGVRPDWHEPDEQEVTARFFGSNFDNAGFWGTDAHGNLNTFGTYHQEMWICLFQEGQPVAEINLATLFAMACGYTGKD